MSVHEVILVAVVWFLVGLYVGVELGERSKGGGAENEL